MDWFPLKVSFHGDPMVLALRERLGNACAEVYVTRIWSYCYLQEQDRFPASAAPALLERAAEWRGRTGALLSALLTCGWARLEGESVVIHGVEKRLRKAEEGRAAAAKRQERLREKLKVTRDTHEASRVSHAVEERRGDERRSDPPVVPHGKWAEMLLVLRERSVLPTATSALRRWLEPMEGEVVEGVLRLVAPSEYHRDFVKDQYGAVLEDLAEMPVVFTVRSGANAA